MTESVTVNIGKSNRLATLLGLFDVEVRVFGTDIKFLIGAGSLPVLANIREVNSKVSSSGLCLTVGRYCDFNSSSRIIIGGEHRGANMLSFSGSPLIKTMMRDNPLNFVSHSKGPIQIGGGCVIGMNAILLSGVCLGNRVIVGAGSVVTSREGFADRTVIAGNPASVLKIHDGKSMHPLDLDPIGLFRMLRENLGLAELSTVKSQNLGEQVIVLDVKFSGNKVEKISVRGVRNGVGYKQTKDLSRQAQDFFSQINTLTDPVTVYLNLFDELQK